MASILDLDTPVRALTGDELKKAQSVQMLGIFALILAIAGIIIPFIADISAFILAKIAMRKSRDNLVPYEYEKWAWWAYRISIVGILWWIIIVVRIVL
jgi:hypothetical protein